MIVGIDPDAKKHGVAIYIDKKLNDLQMLSTPKLVTLLSNLSRDHRILCSIENVLELNAVHAQKRTGRSGVDQDIARKIGRNQQAQYELMQWLEHKFIDYVLHSRSSQWKDDKAFFKRVTGWEKRSNKDTRSAAYFGFLEI